MVSAPEASRGRGRGSGRGRGARRDTCALDRPRGRAAAVAALALVAALAGCTWDPHAAERSSSSSSAAATEPTRPSASSVSHEVSPSPGPTSAAVSSPSPGAAPGAGVAGDLTRPTGRATGSGTGDEVGTLADVTLAGDDDVDRVVLELEGPDVPTWEARYVPRALRDPNGEPVAVDGDAVLQVLLEPVDDPDGRAADTAGPSRVDPQTTPATSGAVPGVTEVVVSAFFEGELQVFVGVEGTARPFRVYGMTDPARVVVEVERP